MDAVSSEERVRAAFMRVLEEEIGDLKDDCVLSAVPTTGHFNDHPSLK